MKCYALGAHQCAPWWAASMMGWSLGWSFGRSASAATRKMSCSPNWVCPDCLPQFLCLWMLYPFLDSKLFWQISYTHWYVRLHTILCPWYNSVTDFVFHHRLIGIHSEAIGADKGEEDCASSWHKYYAFWHSAMCTDSRVVKDIVYMSSKL